MRHFNHRASGKPQMRSQGKDEADEATLRNRTQPPILCPLILHWPALRLEVCRLVTIGITIKK